MFLFLFLIALVIVECFLIASEKNYEGLVTLLAAAIFAWFWWPEFALFIKSLSWRSVLLFLTSYLGAGALVAFVKWVIFNVSLAKIITETRRGYTHIDTPMARKKFVESVRENATGKRYQFGKIFGATYESNEELIDILTQDARDHVGRISFWVLHWPIVAVNLVIEDFIIKIGNWLSEVFNLVLRGFSKLMVSKALQ